MAKPQNFTIYLKDGRQFQIKDVEFKIEGTKVRFSNECGTISGYIFLPFENVAAIIPEQTKQEGQPYIDVYLKESEFQIVAERFEITDKNELRFIWDGDRLIYSTYIDLSEVVAINLNEFEQVAAEYGFEKTS